MAYEYSKPPHNRQTIIEKEYDWESLRSINGSIEFEVHYVKILNELGNKKGMLGEIFFKAQNKIQDPAKLYKLVQLIDEENWLSLEIDIKGEIYEGLLQKNIEDTKAVLGSISKIKPFIKRIPSFFRITWAFFGQYIEKSF